MWSYLLNFNCDINLQEFDFHYRFEFARFGWSSPRKVHFWLTSEDNSFGLSNEHWYDGQVDESLKLDARILGDYPNQFLIFAGDTKLEIVGVDEYRNVESKCSEQSFYECLTKRFAQMDLIEDIVKENGIKCPSKLEGI